MNTLDFIYEKKLVAISRGVYGDDLLKASQIINEEGICLLEITFDQSSATNLIDTPKSIEKVKNALGDKMCVGAGTVMTVEQARAAKAAGADFALAPNTDVAVIHEMKKLGLIAVPGAFTPSEVATAYNEGADIVIALSHLGVDEESAPNRSTDLYANTSGFDFIIDGHSHTVMTEGENGEPIQSTGTAFANIGVVVIDEDSKTIEDNYLLPVSHDEDGTTVYDIPNDISISGYAQEIMDRVNGEYNVVFAQSLVDLNGERDPGNRTEETNLGSLIADAMMWTVLKDEGSLTVAPENALAIVNGGGIRASIASGSITKKDINTVLPFGNTITVVYVTGRELLEALEASTYCTPTAVGGFPQVAGIEFTVDTSKPYDAQDETYPASTYYGPKTINRVTINNINGNAFDENAVYAVITNNFMAAGGDTYYAFASATNQFDTGIPLDEAVMSYITEKLGGVVGEEYASPFGRIHVI